MARPGRATMRRVNGAGLAEFLRQRREALAPDRAGVPPGPGRRRTPGLRREEVAWLAGISADYYERLEQARAQNPSPQVLSSLGRALQLSDEERLHVARLAGHAPTIVGASHGGVPDGVQLLLDRIGAVPAYVLDARYDVMAWNAPAARLFPDLVRLPPERRNVLRMWMHPGATACGAPAGTDREPVRQVAADLREAAARYPADQRLHELIEELAAHDPAFAEDWSRHDVRAATTLRKHVEHPSLGLLELDCQTLRIPGHDQRIVLYSAQPGSRDEAKLAWGASGMPAPPATPRPEPYGWAHQEGKG